MELEHIREFIKLAEIGNYLEASEILYISQSSLSKHIKLLEKELGYELFDRSKRTIQITPYGKIFLKYSQEIITMLYRCNSEIINYSAKNNQSLVIGTLPIMAPYRITDAIVNFQNENINFNITILEGDSNKLLEMLREKKIDLAFVRTDKLEKEEDIQISPFTKDRLVAILPSNHPLSQKDTIDVVELQHDNFLLLSPQTILYQISKNICRKAGFKPNIIYTGERAENIIDLVSKGTGVSLLMEKPASYLSNFKVSIVQIKDTVTSSIGIIYLKENKDELKIRHFLESSGR
jgi:Transcriptional regulator